MAVEVAVEFNGILIDEARIRASSIESTKEIQI